ncbi:hypothetical protein GCM10027591_01460 [Zhihengliuella somnathii]
MAMTRLQRWGPLMIAVFFGLLSAGLLWQGFTRLGDGAVWPALFNLAAGIYWGWVTEVYWRKWRGRSSPESEPAEQSRSAA